MARDTQPDQASHPKAGAAAVDITPTKSVFLFGYPNVRRMSTGVHDPLLATALYLNDGIQPCLLVALDLIGLSKRQVAAARERISTKLSLPQENILIAASHTHSGPITFTMLSNARDSVVPPPDPEVVESILAGIVAAAEQAVENTESAEIGFADAEVVGIGGNRHHPQGPSMSGVPVMAVRSQETKRPIALHYVYSVHPTVLHENSTLISGDFPGMARRYLQDRLAASGKLPVLHHLGAAGNQSPRHAVQANTLAEADRLGRLLAEDVAVAVDRIEYSPNWRIDCCSRSIELPLRSFPSISDAQQRLDHVRAVMAYLQLQGVGRAGLRTAECDLFGAEELVTLAEAACNGRLEAEARACMPAEIQCIRIGSRQFVAWPGEVFIEFAAMLQRNEPDAVVITLANGELQGYLVTEEAVENSWYESSNAIFSSPESGNRLVAATCAMLASKRDDRLLYERG